MPAPLPQPFGPAARPSRAAPVPTAAPSTQGAQRRGSNRRCRSRLAGGILMAALSLGACVPPVPFERVGRPAPPGAPPGTCWDTVIIPARVETVTEQVMVSPALDAVDGAGTQPAVFATETRQEITRPRKESYFETPCPDAMTPEYVSSLQRALAARGLYEGRITATLDAKTRAAVRRYQTDIGIDSASLSLRAARSLGLSAVNLPD